MLALGIISCASSQERLSATTQRVPSGQSASRMTTAFSMTATLTLQHRPKLYFDSNRNNTNYEIYVANADGSDPHALTHDTHYDSWWPQPSPNGAWIVFYRTPRGTHDRDYGKTSLWRMRTDGTDLTEIIPNHGYGWEIQGHAEWSPDSRYLVMFGGSRINPQIWITNADGTNPVQITNRGGTNIDPTWSPNGQQIAFVGCPQSFCLPSSYSIYTMNSEGSDLRRLTNNSMENHDPSYSPDGKYIAWLVHTSTSGNAGLGSWNIFVMNANGSDQHNLTNDSAINSRPAWSIDGSDTILFFRVAPGKKHWQLFSIPVSGGPMTQLTNVHADSEYPIE